MTTLERPDLRRERTRLKTRRCFSVHSRTSDRHQPKSYIGARSIAISRRPMKLRGRKVHKRTYDKWIGIVEKRGESSLITKHESIDNAKQIFIDTQNITRTAAIKALKNRGYYVKTGIINLGEEQNYYSNG